MQEGIQAQLFPWQSNASGDAIEFYIYFMNPFIAWCRAAVIGSLLILPARISLADIRLPHLLSDHIVLQRDKPATLWGWADPGEKVTVTLGEEDQSVTADHAGQWKVALKAHPAGGPYDITITGKNKLMLSDVLFGDVWVCSGQSNMGFPLEKASTGAQEIERAGNPKLRLYTVSMNSLQRPSADVLGTWNVSSPDVVKKFSAVGYLFGSRLQKDLNVPVGLIQSAMGGTDAASWTPLEAMENDPQLKGNAERGRKTLSEFPAKPLDQTGWEAPGFSDASWKTMELPQAWEKSGLGMDKLDGVVWFRKEIEIPADWAGRDLELHTGPIDDGDTTYFNGVKVGAMDVDTPDVYKIPRQYPVPGSLVKPGRAVLAIRVTDRLGDGGLLGTPDQSYLCLAGGDGKRLSLAGPWRFQIADSWPPVGTPSGLYNGMIAPLTPMTVRGVIWYQGESNVTAAGQYRNLLGDLIAGWRNSWGDELMPFVVVQLPNYMAVKPEPGDSQWAALREAQQQVAATVRNVCLAVTIDLGEEKNIHPANKADVAARAALSAEGHVYKKDVKGDAPLYAGMTIEGNKVRVRLSHAEGGLEVRGGTIKGFALAGRDGKFQWADATLDGQDVVVHSDAITEPVVVRYAWADNPASTLYGKISGLPVTPFRSDAPLENAGLKPRATRTP